MGGLVQKLFFLFGKEFAEPSFGHCIEFLGSLWGKVQTTRHVLIIEAFKAEPYYGLLVGMELTDGATKDRGDQGTSFGFNEGFQGVWIFRGWAFCLVSHLVHPCDAITSALFPPTLIALIVDYSCQPL